MTTTTEMLPMWLYEHGIPKPLAEYQFHGKRKWRFDFAWPWAKVALEIEGGVFGYRTATGKRQAGAHRSVQGVLRDIEKYNAATLDGWRVLRVLPSTLYTEETVDLLTAALGVGVGVGVEAEEPG